MTIGYLVAWRKRRVDVVDVCWGITIMAVAAASLLLAPEPTLALYIAIVLIGVWGARLSLHIARRFVSTAVQDERYTMLMNKWPASNLWLQIYVRIFVAQSLLACVVALPVIVIAESASFSYPWLAVGTGLWLIGFAFESIADAQLAAFVTDHRNRGKLMKSGLWRYSRHPNYFGEIIMWWGIAAIAAMSPLWLVAVIGATTISALICFVSGVPLAEARTAQRFGWHQYRRSTSVLVPWPPRADANYLPLRSRCGQPDQQQGRRSPHESLSIVTRMRLARVSGFLASVIQQINSLRASGVISCHAANSFASPSITTRRSEVISWTVPLEIRAFVMYLL